MAEQGNLGNLYAEMKAGTLSRREFMQRAAALGVGASVLQFIMVSTPAAAAPASPGARTGARAQTAATRPTVGTEDQQRGAGGELKLLQWQAATTLNPHKNQGTKDQLAVSIVFEPLMYFLPDGSLVPCLVKEVPSLENGLLAADLTSVTYNLLEGVTWSDGQPFTANDVVFTWQWIADEANQATSFAVYEDVANVEALSDLQVKVTFKAPKLAWYLNFAGSTYGSIMPQHVLAGGGDPAAFFAAPFGTGAFKVESFEENDQVIYVANETYREPNKPFFARINLKGGGDAASAARAVLQTGDYDHAWNLQVEPEVIRDFEQGGKGKAYAAPGNSVEQIRFNFSDPNKEVDGQRSHWQTPHPFFTDQAVRQALSLGVDRATIAERFYLAPGEKPASNILTGIALYESPNTSFEFDVEKGKQLLDEAGWTLDGDVRSKDGVELSVTYTTSINAVRQKTQAVVKSAWEDMGVRVQLKQVDAGIFFDASAGNDQGASHMYTDIEMFTDNPVNPFPQSYMSAWYSNNGENVSQKANGWSKTNYQRYNNPEYDALYDQVSAELDPERAAELFIQMNDILINDFVVVPIVNRAADKYASVLSLRDENLAIGSFEANYWNIANWNRTS